ncbi:PIG-L deacetylase family protein [Salinibacter sp.]|uniref:PIG-L deacetylase family protein n=1 Tax=Salinibacter sp. TaxID=2065818 RepID=UPI0021E7C2FA|nr:PIG-L deacetylase family protein [Salinibacter sp.]
MSAVLVVAPHPDDETLGCGGTMLRHVDQGDTVYWLIVTQISEALGFSEEKVKRRKHEIREVATTYGVENTIDLGFPTTRLDAQPISMLVDAIGEVFHEFEPEQVYVPYRNDIHTDHAAVFDAVASCTKWFRYPSVRRVLAYETLSETEFAMDPDARGFSPNVFVDIEGFVDEKIDIMRLYESEIGTHPFPRSESAIRSLATLRGTTSGFEAAEAFILLIERIE